MSEVKGRNVPIVPAPGRPERSLIQAMRDVRDASPKITDTELMMASQSADVSLTKGASAYHTMTGAAEDEVSQSLLAVQRILEAKLPPGRLAVYEAGGGSTSYMPLSLLSRSDVTVVDIDPYQVEQCDYATDKRVGDIQTLRFAPDSFDLIVCFNVVEHLNDVASALQGFAQAVKPGGLVFIGAPYPHSLSGVVTRFTPHWFHVWFYRRILHYADAGKPGHPPFPTIFDPLVSIEKLKGFMSKLGFETVFGNLYESERYPSLRRKRPAVGRVLDLAAVSINAALLNSCDVRRGDYHAIFQKRQTDQSPAPTSISDR